jgi:hypothetical protein
MITRDEIEAKGLEFGARRSACEIESRREASSRLTVLLASSAQASLPGLFSFCFRNGRSPANLHL